MSQDKPKMMLNPDTEYVRTIRQRIKDNSGFCPCQVEKTPETKGPCKSFREGYGCDCGLYVAQGPQEFDFNF